MANKPADTRPSSAGWQQLNGKMWYCTSVSGNTWYFWAGVEDIKIGSHYYAFDNDGFMREGVWYLDKYYKDSPTYERGWQIRSEWLTLGGKTYYCMSDGTKAVDTELKIGAAYYAFDSSGYKILGWNKNKFYDKTTGKRKTSTFFSDSNKKYYAGSTGVVLKGVQTIDGTMYLFNDTDGALITADTLKKVGSKYYYFSGGNPVTNTWKQSGSSWYYLGSDGVALTNGDKTISGKHYWFSVDGVCLRDGVKLVDNKYWYYKEGVDSLGAKTGRGVRQATSLTDTAGEKVTNLSIARDGYNYKATWKIPDAAKNGNKAYTKIELEWKLSCTDGEIKRKVTLAANATEATLNLNNFMSTVVPIKTYTRNSFYPKTTNKVNSITATVTGISTYVKDASTSYAYSITYPPEPTISDLTFNSSTNKVTTTVKTSNDTKASSERFDMVVTTTTNKATSGSPVSVTTTDTTYTVALDAAGFSNIPNNVSWSYKVEAKNRGLRGDKSTTTKYFYIARPKVPSITAINYPGRGTGDRISCTIKTNNSTSYPVQQVVLQYAIGNYETASSIPSEAWEDGTTDVGTSTSISMNVSQLGTIERGHRVWVRLLNWYLVRNSLQSVSVPVQVTSLYLAPITAANDVVRIRSIEQVGANGLKCEVWWTADNSTKTELSWSTSINAWQSTEQPSTFDFNWYETGSWSDPVTGKTYTRKAIVYIEGLDEGVTYYVRARRVREEESATTYGAYSATETITAGEAADSVSVMADPVVPRGSGLSITWEFQSAKSQEAYDVRTTDGQQLVSGDGPRRTVEVPASRLEELGSSIAYQVLVQSGGAWVYSNVMTVLVVDPPTLTVEAPTTLEEQPLEFSVACNENSVLRIVLTADGITGDPSIGIADQIKHDVLHSVQLAPNWLNGEATITLPEGLDFRDGGNYTLEVVAIDAYGLSSERVQSSITVDWAHKAGSPNCEVVADQETASATLTMAAPEDAEPGDVYDVYRMNGDRPTLIASGLAQDAVITDIYAPYGNGTTRYRVSTRTSDGETTWGDFTYVLEGKTMRFDWAGGSLELPYNIAIQDGYEKGVEIRKHLDGTQDAYWDGSVSRKAALSSTVIKVTRAEDIDAARALGHYTGAVFVRTPDGQAYPADVQVNSIQSSNDYVAAVAFNATEIDMVEAFMVAS